jgi:hypothetical protein
MGWGPGRTPRICEQSLWCLSRCGSYRWRTDERRSPARREGENIDRSWSLGMTPSGTSYMWKRASSPYVKIAPIDLKSAQLTTAGADMFQTLHRIEGAPFNVCGRQALRVPLVRPPPAETVACSSVRAITGTVRQIPHPLRLSRFPRLAPGRHAIVANGRDGEGARRNLSHRRDRPARLR